MLFRSIFLLHRRVNLGTAKLVASKFCSAAAVTPERIRIPKPDVPPYLVSELPEVPLPTQPFGEIFLETLTRVAEQSANKPAVLEAENGECKVTYKELLDSVHRIGAYLKTHGFKRGDIAAIILPNCWEFIAFYTGAIKTGGTCTAVGTHATEFELERLLNDVKCRIALTDTSGYQRISKLAPKLPFLNLLVVLPPRPEECPIDLKNASTYQVVSWSDLLAHEPSPSDQLVTLDAENDLAFLPFSSGTTGHPKGVMLTHRNIAASLLLFDRNFHAVMAALDKNWSWSHAHTLCFLPFYHIYGFGIVLFALMRGTTLVTFKAFNAELFCQCIEKYKVSLVCVVPPILVFLAKHPIVDKYDLSSVQFVMSGAAPLPEEIRELVLKRLTHVKYIGSGYGLTETTMASHVIPPDLRYKPGSSGKLLQHLQQKVIDTETGETLGYGEKGELCIRGPTVMKGYYNRPEANAQTLDEDGWLHTGDIAYVDEDGYLYIVDRLKELIKVRGFQVPPAELEELLHTHPLIADVAVVGVPDGKAGEFPRAYVVRKSDHLTEEDVTNYVKDRVSHYKQLRGGVVFVDQIPKSAAGKILRRVLREMVQTEQ